MISDKDQLNRIVAPVFGCLTPKASGAQHLTHSNNQIQFSLRLNFSTSCSVQERERAGVKEVDRYRRGHRFVIECCLCINLIEFN